jgi:hypothetical protein
MPRLLECGHALSLRTSLAGLLTFVAAFCGEREVEPTRAATTIYLVVIASTCAQKIGTSVASGATAA